MKKLNSSKIDTRKKRLFTSITLAIPLLFFCLLEIGLRLFGYAGNSHLFVPAQKPLTDYLMFNRDVARRYFFMQNTVPRPSKDLFLKKKPKNGYRIFALGGSTTAGFPYGNNVTFSRILNYRLSDTFPDKTIEVINTSMGAINSYTLLDLMDEILDQEPDAILIYAGHNEYYGALGVASMESLGKMHGFTKFYLRLRKFKTFLLVRDLVASLRKLFQKTIIGEKGMDATHTLMARIVANREIPYRSPLYELGKAQFRKNLFDIFKKAKKAGVPVMISEIVSNLRDHPPFVSVKYDTFPTADRAFQIARQLEKQKDYDEARIAYRWAKDLDALRFRASEEFNDIIREVAQQFDFPIVPMTSVFEKKSPHGLLGNTLFLEHLHPNVNGYFLMADAFYEHMKSHGMVSSTWDSTRIKSTSYYRRHWGLSELDSVYADLSIFYLEGGWPFKPNFEPNRALQNYSPSTKAESLAVVILIDENTSLETGHLKMAEYYRQIGRLDKSLQEYVSLYHMIPFEIEFYQCAVQVLLQLKDYDRALEVLFRSKKFLDTPFADKWIGQIFLVQNRLAEALPYLESAQARVPADEQLLYNLCRAYLTIGDEVRAAEAMTDLRKYFPQSPFIGSLITFKSTRQGSSP